MLQNLLDNNGSNSTDLSEYLAGFGALVLPLLILVGVILIAHAISSFCIPFYIRSMKKSQKEISSTERVRLNVERKMLDEIEQQTDIYKEQIKELKRQITDLNNKINSISESSKNQSNQQNTLCWVS